MMLAFGTLGVVLLRDHVVIAVTIAALLPIGVWYVAFRVPTRERVLERSRTPTD